MLKHLLISPLALDPLWAFCYNLKTLELVNKQNLIEIYIRELDRELCTGLFSLYTKTLWSMLTTFSLPYIAMCFALRSICCYKLRTLELVKRKNFVLELTQENSIENSVQDCLSYIQNPMVHATLLLAYPKWPCVHLKVNR